MIQSPKSYFILSFSLNSHEVLQCLVDTIKSPTAENFNNSNVLMKLMVSFIK